MSEFRLCKKTDVNYSRIGEIPVNWAGAQNKVWIQVEKGVTEVSIKVTMWYENSNQKQNKQVIVACMHVVAFKLISCHRAQESKRLGSIIVSWNVHVPLDVHLFICVTFRKALCRREATGSETDKHVLMLSNSYWQFGYIKTSIACKFLAYKKSEAQNIHNKGNSKLVQLTDTIVRNGS